MGVSSVPVRVSAATEFGQIRALLAGARLPVQDLDTAPGLRCWVVEPGGAPLLEPDRADEFAAGLLRSLVVAPAHRRRGLARSLVATVEREAAADGIERLVLLTQTAEALFSALGYSVVDRASVPEEIKESAEFRSLCPASARCMTKALPAQKPREIADAGRTSEHRGRHMNLPKGQS